MDNPTSFANLIHPDDTDAVWAAVANTFENDKHFDIEFRFIKKDGSPVWVRSRGDVFRDPNGKPLLMTGFITDIQRFKERAVQSS